MLCVQCAMCMHFIQSAAGAASVSASAFQRTHCKRTALLSSPCSDFFLIFRFAGEFV